MNSPDNPEEDSELREFYFGVPTTESQIQKQIHGVPCPSSMCPDSVAASHLEQISRDIWDEDF